jgi:ATP-dependent DNA ligase
MSFISKSNVYLKNGVIKDYPELMKKDKNGKTRLWKIQAIFHDDSYWISTTHGMQDGKMISTEKEVKTGKNIGKKNETSIEQQLILVCDKTFKDKKEKESYRGEEIETDKEKRENKSYAPMLAASWDPTSTVKRKVDIVFPCYVQPKLDGIRCLTYVKDDVIVNQSRQLKYFNNLKHINDELEDLFLEYPNIVFDGELYNHTLEFNNIAGVVKKIKLKDEDKKKLLDIQYHIYDCFIENEYLTFEERIKILETKIKKMKYVKLVPTHKCKTADDVPEFHAKFLGNKYEGTILRNKLAPYEFTRSKHLQKYKSFFDDEFEIVDYKQGSGLDDGTVIWRCKTSDGSEFDVRPTGTVEERKKLFKNGDKYIGKFLTVKYQELSSYKIPRFPVGIAVRDYE